MDLIFLSCFAWDICGERVGIRGGVRKIKIDTSLTPGLGRGKARNGGAYCGNEDQEKLGREEDGHHLRYIYRLVNNK